MMKQSDSIDLYQWAKAVLQRQEPLPVAFCSNVDLDNLINIRQTLLSPTYYNFPQNL